MSENMVHLVIRDTNFVLNEESKAKAYQLFEEIIPECEYLDMMENYSFLSESGEEINAKFDMFALEPHGCKVHWQIDDEREIDEIDVIYYGSELIPQIIQKFEDILGSKIEVIWERK